jgi:hypothetical protein
VVSLGSHSVIVYSPYEEFISVQEILIVETVLLDLGRRAISEMYIRVLRRVL